MKNKLKLIKNDDNVEKKDNKLKSLLKEKKEELDFIENIIKKLTQEDVNYIITNDGYYDQDSLNDKMFSKYNITLLKQQISKIENNIRKSNFRIISNKHLKLID